MNIFIFKYIEELTSNYHPEGGLVVIAENLDAAIALAESKGARITHDERNAVVTFALLASPPPTVFIFPNAGCC